MPSSCDDSTRFAFTFHLYVNINIYIIIYIIGQVNLKSLLGIGTLVDFLEGRREVGQREREMDRMKSREFERSKRKE